MVVTTTGSDDRTEHRSNAADERHHDHLGRSAAADVDKRHDLKNDGLERTGQACKRGRQREQRHLEVVHAIAERHRAVFVLANGLDDLSERRVDDAIDEHDRRPSPRASMMK